MNRRLAIGLGPKTTPSAPPMASEEKKKNIKALKIQLPFDLFSNLVKSSVILITHLLDQKDPRAELSDGLGASVDPSRKQNVL
jgi:hypothetical protein